MPTFMFVSGFLWSKAYIADDFSIKRPKLKLQILNLIPVYVLFSVVQITIQYLFSAYTNTSIDLNLSAFLAIAYKPYAPYWYLYILIIYYAISYTIGKTKITWMVLFISIIAACISSLNLGFEDIINRFFYYIPIFYLGAYVCKNANTFKGKNELIIASVSAIMIAVSVFLYNILNISIKPHTVPIINLIIGISCSLLLFVAFMHAKYLNIKIFRLCGEYCLEIYVIHCFLTASLRSVLPHIGLTAIVPNIICNLILSTTIPIAVSYVLKRIGLHQYIFRLASTISSKKK